MNNFEKIALQQAKKAFREGEVPIGAVIVKNGEVISRAHNCREKKQVATKHAELVAIEKACKQLGSWRLDGCQMYVTLEPCPMCAGAIANARIKTLFYMAEEKSSGDQLLEKIFSSKRLNHKVQFIRCEGESESSKLLTNFFENKRK